MDETDVKQDARTKRVWVLFLKELPWRWILVTLGAVAVLSGIEYQFSLLHELTGLNSWVFLSGLVAPTLFWFGYLYHKDRYVPEPIPVLLFSYLAGIAAGFGCSFLYDLTVSIGLPHDPWAMAENNRGGFLLYCLLVIGPVEEICKFLPFWLMCMRFKTFDEPIDGFIYASFIALGFASYENVIYFQFLEGFELYGRAIASPLVHTMFASIWGYACSKSHLAGGLKFFPVAMALLVSALVHGIYDFFATDPALRLGAALAIFLIWSWRIHIIRRLHAIHLKTPGNQ